MCGLLLILQGHPARAGGERAAWYETDEWMRSRRHLVAFVAVVGVNVFYILLAVDAGRVPGHGHRLSRGAGPRRAPGARRRGAARDRATFVIHYAFYKLLKVPLPLGRVEGERDLTDVAR